ncbi:MAG: hypothetical protein ACFBSC_13565 [Microcoleaceae cyanobacterium]
MRNHSNPDDTLYFNGIDVTTGDYLFAPQTIDQVSEIVQESLVADQVDGQSSDEPTSDENLKALIERNHYLSQRQDRLNSSDQKDNQSKRGPVLGPIEGVDPKKLSEAGWGIIFSTEIGSEIREALSELVNHRRQAAGEYFQEYNVSPKETASHFLKQFKANIFEPANPSQVPYYLLIVGDFQAISFDFQHQLDVQYAVGRIYFETPAEYAQYAHSVVQAETTCLALPCTAKFFGVRNPDDPSTALSADHLIQPLTQFLTSDPIFQKKNSHWQIKTYLAEQATKAQLKQLLGGDETPALLFTASHGAGFPPNHDDQLNYQGALVCQDWPGPEAPLGEMSFKEFCFSAKDVTDNDRLFGLISFHFACFGAGTPQMDQFGHHKDSWREIAPCPFVAKLPQRLLSHPSGGALAFISHFDRAWGQSYHWQGQAQINSFHSTLQRLMEGHPVGSALEYFNQRYAAVSSKLTNDLWYVKSGKKPNNLELSYLWTANNDARGYMIIGDPAVRLMVSKQTTSLERRPEIESFKFSLGQPGSNEAEKAEEIPQRDFSHLANLFNALITQIRESEASSRPFSEPLIRVLEVLTKNIKQTKTDEDMSRLEQLLETLAAQMESEGQIESKGKR